MSKKRFKAFALRNKLADNIRRHAAHHDFGINELADTAMVSRSQLFDVLSSKKGATVDFVAKIARPLRMEAYKLLQ